MVLLRRKLYFSKDPEGVQHFAGRGGSSFPGGTNANLIIQLFASEYFYTQNLFLHYVIYICFFVHGEFSAFP